MSSRGRSGGGKSSGRTTGRQTTVRVRTAKSRSNSSARWLQRQLNDPYVAEAQKRGYRSRAAFKLLQLDEKFHFFKKGMRVVDLGAAPGGWIQVALERIGKEGRVVGIDLLPVDPVPGSQIIVGDFLDADAPQRLVDLLGGPANAVLSDMAASSTGHANTDHLRIMTLAEVALDFAEDVLAPDGFFLCKVLQGGSEKELLDRLRKSFAKVRHVKPPASRSDSAELYVLATGFRGKPTTSGSEG
ncbi:RlmE family RNA methyltransferase [Limibacillus halophilus]|uniref:Ribosomal RNA large subunit methyltransferase E n=1 Tax=Limibacillus halophilus TaxID=1579333 RepID=A0A839SRP2_9PROT|nr:RlmE family RNA methyltransferase [Limibacillus halophilus]MBB3064639.1 23S rRNA (uridine2552-2'-O)-methyltransferase [Limibacillus halophilus]